MMHKYKLTLALDVEVEVKKFLFIKEKKTELRFLDPDWTYESEEQINVGDIIVLDKEYEVIDKKIRGEWTWCQYETSHGKCNTVELVIADAREWEVVE